MIMITLKFALVVSEHLLIFRIFLSLRTLFGSLHYKFSQAILTKFCIPKLFDHDRDHSYKISRFVLLHEFRVYTIFIQEADTFQDRVKLCEQVSDSDTEWRNFGLPFFVTLFTTNKTVREIRLL